MKIKDLVVADDKYNRKPFMGGVIDINDTHVWVIDLKGMIRKFKHEEVMLVDTNENNKRS